jgi:hypothetical protein
MNPISARLVTSQRWKLQLALALALVAGVCMWFDKSLTGFLALPEYVLTLAGAVLGLATLLGTALAVRCPNCKISLVWFAVSKKSSSSWLAWLLDETTCPRCGFKETNNLHAATGE